MLTPTCFMVDTMDLVIMDLDMDTTDILLLTMERGLLMLSLRLMPIPTSSMVDTMDLDTMGLDMDITDTLMLTTERGLLMPNPRLMLTLIFSMVDTTDKLSTKEEEVPAAKETNSHPNLLLK